MNDEERTQTIAYLEQMGEVSTLTEVEEIIVEELSDDADLTSLGGTGEKTVWEEGHGRVITVKRKKLVYTHDGFLIDNVDLIAGFCAVCRDNGVRTIISKASARQCSRCGRLLCGDHQVTVGEDVYCPVHGKWHRIRKLIFG